MEGVLELAERIHLIPSGEVSWEEVLAQTSRMLNARATPFLVYDLSRVEVLDVKYDTWPMEWVEAYENHYVKLDRRVHFVIANPRARLVSDYDLIDEREMARDEAYQEFYLPQDLKYFAAAMLPRSDDGIRPVLAAQRAPEQGPFLQQDLLLLSAIASHFLQVYQLLNRIDAGTLSGLLTTSALERFTFPVLIVDQHAELVWANEAGRALLASGSALHCCKHHLHAARCTETRRLRDLVHSACDSGLGSRGGSMTLTGESGLQDCSVFVSPLHFAQDDARLLRLRRRRFALLLVQQQHTGQSRGLDFVQQLHGLSGQERRLLELLVAGRELREASEALGITYETSRQYLKRLFNKTDTRSQSQLMRMVLKNPAFFVDSARSPPTGMPG